jgi:hypothetical protein
VPLPLVCTRPLVSGGAAETVVHPNAMEVDAGSSSSSAPTDIDDSAAMEVDTMADRAALYRRCAELLEEFLADQGLAADESSDTAASSGATSDAA